MAWSWTNMQQKTNERSLREIFVLNGRFLTLKLSYRNGTLTGVETYHGVPTDSYWLKNYNDGNTTVRELSKTIQRSFAFEMVNGYFLWWNNDRDKASEYGFKSATEYVGNEAEHMPDSLPIDYDGLTGANGRDIITVTNNGE